MKQWLLAASAAALITAAVPAMAAKAPQCPGTKMPTPETSPAVAKAEAEAKAADAAARVDLQKSVNRNWSPAMIDLAAMNEQGGGDAPIDRAGALDLYERAAGMGEVIGQRKMCVAYLLGEGRPKDAAKAMGFCNALSDKDAVGLFASGYDYQMGLSGPADESLAMAYYIEATKTGSGDAANAMAGLALKANKVELARQWYQRGAYLGSADAIDGLGTMTEAGQGGLKDADEALWLYRNAADRGNAHATEQLGGRTVDIPRVCMSIDPDSPVRITHTYTSKDGPQSETLSFKELVGLLSRNFPEIAMEKQVDGMATIECYIDANSVFDACILQREAPASLQYGRVLEALFNGHMAISATDDSGLPTARRRFTQTVRWKVGR